MKNMMRFVFIAFIVLVMSACSTIHFKNGDTQGDGMVTSEMHHELAWQLYELSKPVDLSQKCESGWSNVKTEVTFLDGVLGSLDGMIIGAFVPLLPIDVWAPITVETTCAG